MKNKRWFLWILLLAATFVLTAGGCGGGSGGSGSGGGDAPEVDGETLTVAPTTLSLGVGEEKTLTARGDYSGTLEWLSDDDSIVAVEGDGATATVTGVKVGEAKITVSDGSGASAACAVSVIDPGETLPDPDTDTWDGTIDTSWFVDDRQPHEYRIETGAQLAGFAKLVNAGRFFAGSTFILTNNIDLAGREWTPIGYSSYYFMGTFDGGGHTISNMRISMRMDRSDLYAGLFGRNSGIIKDVCLSNVYSTHPGGRIGCAGGLVGHNAGTITGCASSGLVSSNATTSSSYAGGLVGYNDGTITDCASSGSVSSVFVSISSSYAGGLVGHNTGTITGCASSGSVSSLSIDSSSYAGGLVGYNNGTITDCASSGSVDSKTTISSSSSSPSAGGLVGWNDGGRIEDCASKTGKVSAHAAPGRTAYSGGFIGYVAGGTLINNHNETRITPAIGRDMRKNPAGPSDDI